LLKSSKQKKEKRKKNEELRKLLEEKNKYLIDECGDYFNFNIKLINKKKYLDDMLKAMGVYLM
jgi:heme oxygenase